MAITKPTRNMLSTGVSDSSDSTFLTADSSENATFAGNLIVTGNLTVSGTQTVVSSTVETHADPLIELNTGAGSNSNDLGFVFERGSTGDNAALIWDESADVFVVGTTTATGTSTGNMSITAAGFTAGAITGTTGTFSGEVSAGTLDIGGTNITSTAAEINLLDALDRGSILYGNASGVTTVLGQGSADQVLTSDGTDIAWADASSFDADAAQVFNESGAAVDFRIESDDNANMFFVDGSEDKIGIGTSSPTRTVDINYASTAPDLRLGCDGNDAPMIILDADVSSSGDAISHIVWRWNNTDTALITGYAGDDTTNKDDGGLRFFTRESGTTLAEVMRIDSSGNVGIGSASLGSRLQVNDIGGTSHGLTLRHVTNDTGKGFKILFKGGDTGGNIVDYGEFKNEIITRGVGTQSSDFIFKNAISGSLTEVFRIGAAGGIGIGTTHGAIVGKIHAEGTVTNGGLTGLMISNRGTGTSAYDAIAFRLSDTSGTHWTAASLEVKKENSWTSTAATRDSRMNFRIIKDDAWVDALTLRATGKVLGKVVMDLQSGSNRWAPSGTWANLGNSSASSLENQPANCLYLCEAAIQSLASYTATMLVYKCGTSGSPYHIIGQTNTSGHMRMNGHYVQYKQNSGADQTGTSGPQRINVVPGGTGSHG